MLEQILSEKRKRNPTIASAKLASMFYENTYDNMQKINEVQLDIVKLHSPEAIMEGIKFNLPKI